MTAILTTVRNAIWTCLDNYADLNPGAVSVFTTKFKTDALLERLELQGVFLSDLPAVAVRWAAIDPSWQTYNSQIWPVVVVLETWSALGSLSTIEARSQTVIEAVGRYEETPGLNYVTSTIGHHVKQWGPLSIEAVELRDKHKAYRSRWSFIVPHDHSPYGR